MSLPVIHRGIPCQSPTDAHNVGPNRTALPEYQWLLRLSDVEKRRRRYPCPTLLFVTAAQGPAFQMMCNFAFFILDYPNRAQTVRGGRQGSQGARRGFWGRWAMIHCPHDARCVRVVFLIFLSEMWFAVSKAYNCVSQSSGSS